MIRARILLADDHTLICAGLQKILEPHYEVVGIVGDGRALLKAAAELNRMWCFWMSLCLCSMVWMQHES